MQKLVKDYLNELNRRHKKGRRVAVAVVLMVVMVVGSMVSILTQYGVAMTGTPKCGKEEHLHGEACYMTDLSCGWEEQEGHTHTDACRYPQELVCGKEEGEDHTHTEECYAAPEGWACGLEESEGHTHTDACYSERLICQEEEHTHTDDCYIDTEAGVEEAAVWEQMYAEVVWTGKWGQDLVTAASAQIGYQESVDNYELTESGRHQGYTRYGHWAGNRYADWDAAFVNFCLHYAGLDKNVAFPSETDAAEWRAKWGTLREGNEAYLTAAAGYTPQAGDLVFFRREGEETAQQMGIVSLYKEETNEIQVIEGNCENRVKENGYAAGDPSIVAYLKITELENAYRAASGEEAEDPGADVESETFTGDPGVPEDMSAAENTASPGVVFFTDNENGVDEDDSAQEAGNEDESTDGGENGAEGEEEAAARERVTELLEALPTAEEVEAKLAGLRTQDLVDENGVLVTYEEYHAAIKNQTDEAREAYNALTEDGKKEIRDYLKLRRLEALLAVPKWAASIPADATGGRLIMDLLYSDQKDPGKLPEGETIDPNYGKNGYFRIYTSGILGTMENLDEVTVTLYFPAEKIDEIQVNDPDNYRIFPFEQVDTMPEHEIHPVEKMERDGKAYYTIGVTFYDYHLSGMVAFPFHFGPFSACMPYDYELDVFGVIDVKGSMEGEDGSEETIEFSSQTADNVYRPNYSRPGIRKYVNTNRYESMAEDGAKASAVVGEDGVIQDPSYVSFWYQSGGEPWYYREYEKLILTDTLPEYPDKDGTMHLAEFVPEANPGWTLSEDGKSVSYEIVTDISHQQDKADRDLMNQVLQVELKLRFPGCAFEETEAGTNDRIWIRKLKNHIRLECVPREASDYEKTEEVKKEEFLFEDDLEFVLTSQIGDGTIFGKANSANSIMDTRTARSGQYRWSMTLENKEVEPLENIVISDTEMDERLKFEKIEIGEDLSLPMEGVLDYVEVFTEDGGSDRFDLSDFSKRYYEYDGLEWRRALELPKDKVYVRFDIHLREDYRMKVGESCRVRMYSTFKDPERSHYIPVSEEEKTQEGYVNPNLYVNKAMAVYQRAGVYNWIWSENQFLLEESYENVWISKYGGGNLTYKDGNGNASYVFFYMRIHGVLSGSKEYRNLRIVDLLPEALEVHLNANGMPDFGTGSDYVERVEVIENYHNSGRTAVIFYLDVERVRKTLDLSGGTEAAVFTFKAFVSEQAPVGEYINENYLVCDDNELEKIVPMGEGAQISKDDPNDLTAEGDPYDLDNDGDTIEWLRMGSSKGSIIAPLAIFCNKYIAPEGSNAFRRTGLRLGVGEDFQYKLVVRNGAESSIQTNLEVYDVLPRIGDKSINNGTERGSEFSVRLSGRICPPEGYTAYYTDSVKVYEEDMRTALSDTEIIWHPEAEITDWEAVTAFKLIADPSIQLRIGESVEFLVPAKVTETLSEDSLTKLSGKESEDRESGTAVYLESLNSFGYRSKETSGTNWESNYVKAEIAFAGFSIKKVDQGTKKKALAGAEFTLEKKDEEKSASEAEVWEPVAAGVSEDGRPNYIFVTGEDGVIHFSRLESGTYRLTEVKAPDGYALLAEPIEVTIEMNELTREYQVTMHQEGCDQSGNQRDPFLIGDSVLYRLPSTGGAGIDRYLFGGVLLMAAAALMIYRNQGKGVLKQ